MRTALAAASTLAILAPAFAQNATLPRRPSLPPASQALLIPRWQPGTSLNEALTASRRIFRELDANVDGQLSRADAEAHEIIARANGRSAHANNVMTYDLDGDGSVTEDEIRTRQRYDHRLRDDAYTSISKASADAELRRILGADTDKDGRVTWREALDSWTVTVGATAQGTSGHAANVYEALAATGRLDGTLDSSLFGELFAQRFRTIDTDGNGTISQEEFARAQEQLKLDQIAKARADCVIPRASAAGRVALLSAYEARGVSTATIDSQDVEVRTGRITIEAGDEPLYVVALSSTPVIWRFDGATERIERVVLGSNTPNTSAGKPPLVGATGVPADKVQFLPRHDCLIPFTDAPSLRSAAAIAAVRDDTGKDPIAAARYDVSSFSVPFGGTAPQQHVAGGERPAATIQKQADPLKINGGVIEIAPETVVASGKVEPYEVLPSRAGLLQLVNSGALERNKLGEFLIKQKIRFPAGLYGARSARFLLLRGVPTPEGNPGHSCVMSEETGRPVAGSQNPC